MEPGRREGGLMEGLGAAPGTVGPGNHLSPELAQKIRMVVLDVDGVLTDGGVYVGELPGGEAPNNNIRSIEEGRREDRSRQLLFPSLLRRGV